MSPRLLVALAAAVVGTLLALPAGPAVAGSFGPEGPDVASYQHPSGAGIDWNRVRNAGTRRRRDPPELRGSAMRL